MHVKKQLKRNAFMIERLSDLMFGISNYVKGLSKRSFMVHTHPEQVAKSQNDLLNEMNNAMNDHVVRVMTRGGRMTQDPLYPEGHPIRIEQDSQRINNDVHSSSKKKNKKKIELSMLLVNPRQKNFLRIVVMFLFMMAQSDNEHPSNDNDVHDDAQPDNDKEPDNDVEIEPVIDLDNPPPHNK